MANAEHITRALGGKWYGRYGLTFCPAHDNARSPALSLSDGDNGLLLARCHAGCNFTSVMAALRETGLVSGLGCHSTRSLVEIAERQAVEQASVAKREAQAQAVWTETQHIGGTLAEAYLRQRGISCELPGTIRFHPDCWHPTSRRFPAMVALVEGTKFLAVHRTYLHVDCSGKAKVDPPKAMLGGIAATGALHAAGLKVICVEAADRIGGRAHTDTGIFGVPFDTGAHWLHNEHVNALKAPGLALGLDLYPTPERAVTHKLEDSSTLWDDVDRLYDAIRQSAKADAETEIATGRPTDRSLADLFIDNDPWSFTAIMMFALSIGRDLPDTSLRDMAIWEGGTDWFCREGFGHLVARTAEGLPFKLSTPVTKIEALPDGVRIKTNVGEIRARAVIVTASVGVLAEDVIRFDPPLEADRRAAFELITMGDYNHAALMFRPGALPLQPDTWLTYQLQPDDTGVARGGGFLCNIAGTNLSSFETSGSFSRSLQAAGPEAAIEHALESLAGMFGSAIKQDFIKGHATAWRNEPYVRGSYAGSLPGGQGQLEVLGRAHADRVHFAGEASHIGQQCTVSGAHLEGLRAARDVMAQLGRTQRT